MSKYDVLVKKGLLHDAYLSLDGRLPDTVEIVAERAMSGCDPENGQLETIEKEASAAKNTLARLLAVLVYNNVISQEDLHFVVAGYEKDQK